LPLPLQHGQTSCVLMFISGFIRWRVICIKPNFEIGSTACLALYKQIIQIKLNGDTVKEVLPGNITEVIFYDTVQSLPHDYKFQTGYPEIDNLNRNNFYQVLSDGKVTLLKSSIKKINKTKNEMSGEVSSQFDIYEDHYLYVKYEMKRIKKDKEYILNLLADKKKELETYITAQKLNFKSIDSIKKIIKCLDFSGKGKLDS
jgi:hypothetical protein